MMRGSSSERSSVRAIVLLEPSERVSFFSGSALARLSERVTSACARSASAVGDLGLGLGLRACHGRQGGGAGGRAPRSATLVVGESGPSSALSER